MAHVLTCVLCGFSPSQMALFVQEPWVCEPCCAEATGTVVLRAPEGILPGHLGDLRPEGAESLDCLMGALEQWEDALEGALADVLYLRGLVKDWAPSDEESVAVAVMGEMEMGELRSDGDRSLVIRNLPPSAARSLVQQSSLASGPGLSNETLASLLARRGR